MQAPMLYSIRPYGLSSGTTPSSKAIGRLAMHIVGEQCYLMQCIVDASNSLLFGDRPSAGGTRKREKGAAYRKWVSRCFASWDG